MSDDSTRGPVEIAVIGFPGNKFTGEVAPRSPISSRPARCRSSTSCS